MIVVFDTNVFVASIITQGVCSKLLYRARSREFCLVACPFIMTEIRRVLSKKFHFSHNDISLAMEPISEAIEEIIEHNLKISNICRDSDDDNILACAFAAKADYLVTGDSDLLDIKYYEDVKIITPRDFEALFI
ncbi:MAG: putative toxin-antitoxin system toxin component, PIN family [Candidatus Schekmanbacteria bacterium]|nr:putative toxin-antitoxin system toxin component, PIN family [Candidatus Schekmanbacteria bacterium]